MKIESKKFLIFKNYELSWEATRAPQTLSRTDFDLYLLFLDFGSHLLHAKCIFNKTEV